MRIRPTVAALAATAAAAAAAAAPAGAAEVQIPFAYDGAAQSWTVPTGVTEATFTLIGGAGGDAGVLGPVGGFGAQVRATLPVTPGETLTLVVGGQGASSGAPAWDGGAAGANGDAPAAGAGGGATAVLSSTGAALLVAGGGGGAGGPGAGSGGTGGDGGSAELPGAPGGPSGPSTPGGGGLVGGAGGAAGGGSIGGANGGAASGGRGGAGGAGASGSGGGNGGGGGGGYAGGGGGGAGGSGPAGTDAAGGGGGAGGTSFATASATGVAPPALASTRGNGLAIVSYEPLAAPQVRVQPTLSGVAQVGRALTCELGTWTGSPSLTVAWLRGGMAIAGATSAVYTLAEADAGQQVACQVTAVNAAGSAVARTPAITIPITGGPAPATLPSVSGRAQIGARLTCAPGTWSGGTPTFAYAWLRNGRAVAGQTSATYTLGRADAGQSLQCAVTATVGGLATTAQSTAVGGPARLVILTTTALVSRGGGVTVQVACFGPTDCAVPRMTATSGQVIARAGARTIRSGNSSKYAITLGARGIAKLRRAGSSIAVRFVCAPTGGYGGNARLTWVALKGAS